MNDETPDIQAAPSSGEASPEPDAGREPVAAKKKRSRISARAATAAIEERIGHKFADPALLTTAFTHVSALKSARKCFATGQSRRSAIDGTRESS